MPCINKCQSIQCYSFHPHLNIHPPAKWVAPPISPSQSAYGGFNNPMTSGPVQDPYSYDPRRQVVPPERYTPQRANSTSNSQSSHGNPMMTSSTKHVIETDAKNARVYSPHAMSEPEYGPASANWGYKLVPIRDTEMHRHYSDNEGVPMPSYRMVMSHEYSPPSPAPEDPMVDCRVPSSPTSRSRFVWNVDEIMKSRTKPNGGIQNFCKFSIELQYSRQGLITAWLISCVVLVSSAMWAI